MIKQRIIPSILLVFIGIGLLQQAAYGAVAPSFAMPQIIPNTPKVDRIVMGDFDGDGYPDIATLDRNSGKVEVHFGDGNGGFRGTAADFTISGSDSSIASIAEGDLDGSGTASLVAPIGPGVKVYQYNGSTFVNVAYIDLAATGIDATKVAVGNLSASGSQDIVVSDDFGNTGVVWIPNDGTAAVQGAAWTFGTPKTFPAGGDGYYARLQLADVNGDGLDDVILTSISSLTVDHNGNAGTTVGVLLDNGDGTLAAEVYYGNPTLYATPNSSLSTSAVTLADVNGDGIPDLVSTCALLDTNTFEATYYLSVNQGNGDGTFQDGIAFTLPNGSTDLAAADITGTDQDAIVTCDYSTSGFTVTQLTGTGASLALARQDSTPADGPSYNCLTLGYTDKNGTLTTFNNDPLPDVLLGTSSYTFINNTSQSQFAVFQNTTTAGTTGTGAGTTLALPTLAIDGTFSAGGAIDFSAMESSTVSGMYVRVQYSTTPSVEGSWTDLPDGNGGFLTFSGTAGVYTFSKGGVDTGTVYYPAGTAVYFRAITAAKGYADAISNILGPFTLHQAGLSISAGLVTTSDTSGTLHVAHIGDDLTYTFTWVNTGDLPAANLHVKATVPTYIDATSNLHVQFPLTSIDLKGNPYAHYTAAMGGSNATITWDTADLQPGYSQSVSFSVHLTPAVRADQQIGIGNYYEVYSSTNQPPFAATGYSSGAANIGTTVRGPIKLTVTPDVTQAAPGGYINYILTLKNEASYTARGVVIAEPVPEFTDLVPYDSSTKLGTTFLSAAGRPTSSPAVAALVGKQEVRLNNPLRINGSLPLPALPPEVNTFLAENPQITLPSGQRDEVLFIAGNMKAGASVSVRFTVQVQYTPGADITDGEIKNLDYGAYFKDPTSALVDTMNDSGNIFTPVQGAVTNAPNLGMVKIATPQTVSPGDQITLGLVVKNQGMSAANDVFVEDSLPAGTTLLTQGKTPLPLTPGSAPIALPDTAIGFVGKSSSITASKANYFVTLSQDDVLHVGGLHLEPNATIAIYYTVQVPKSTPVPATLVSGESFVGAGNGNQSVIGTGTSRVVESVPPGLPEMTYIQVTGDVQLRTAPPGRGVPQPITSSNAAATRTALDALYKKDKNAAPSAGTQRYLIQYENTGLDTANGARLSFAIPANTVFYRAEFMAGGKVVAPGKGQSIDPTTPLPLATGTATFNLGNLKGLTGGALMVEVINLPSVVNSQASLVYSGTPIIYTGAIPQTLRLARKPAMHTDLTSTDSGGVIVYDGSTVPKVGVLKVVPQAVHPGDTFAVQFTIINYGDIDLNSGCDVTMQAPAGTQIVGVNADRGFVQSQSATAVDVLFTPIVFGSHGANGMTVTLQATGAAGTDIVESSIQAHFPYVGTFQPAPTLIHIVDPGIALSNATITTVTGVQFANIGEMVIVPIGHDSDGVGQVVVSGPVSGFGDYNHNIAFMVSDDGNGNRIVAGDDTGIPLLNLPVLNSTDTKGALAQLASVVSKQGGNIFNGPQANLMTPDGLVNNETGALATTLKALLKAGAESVLPSGNLTYNPGGGANTATVSAGVIHAQGGGLVLTQGGGVISNDGGSVISNDGGSVISNDGGSVISNDGGSAISKDGAGLISQDGLGVVSHEADSLVSNQNSAAVATTTGGNIVAAGGGNIVAAGGGNIVAAGGGNIVAAGGGN